jgi:hypothetical protein
MTRMSPTYNPNCKRCVALDLDHRETLEAGLKPEPVESPCKACGVDKEAR